ncbi:MAG: GDSL-type esterase/lipase family protein [candidate division KSB1 bacterium]|nr:GDSL-type esterase/lipase family protein [candidate division KSB1 bacterium]
MNQPGNFGSKVMVAGIIIFFILFTAAFSWGATYKIMPLGDSITKGVVGSSSPGGYRDDLQDLLSNEFVDYDFVGSQADGTGFDPNHEGYAAATVDYIDQNVATWVSNARPHFVLLMIGTNDLGVLDVETIGNKINSICDKIYNVDNTTTIFLSSILPRSDSASKDSAATQVNRRIKRIVVDKLAAGMNIYYVGNGELFKTNPNWVADYMFDGIHPNDTGYAQMAQLYWSAIMNIIKKDAAIVIDNFNRSAIGIGWEADPAFALETVAPGQRELKNTSTESRWNMMAVYKAVTNPGEVSIRWGQNASADGIENGGLALKLNRASTNANGYLLRVMKDGTLNLWTIVNGSPGDDIASASGTQPTAGQVFKVVLSSDAVAHHFHCYIDDNYVGTVSDFEKRRGNEAELYAGVMLRGSLDGSTTLDNNIDDFNLRIVGDITPPAKVSNLAVASTSGSSVTLTWKAPGDDSLTDRASFYDIRYSLTAITNDNWKNATKVTNADRPKAPGSTESFSVMGLEGNKKYYFALKTGDEENNWSLLSNVVSATTSGGSALQKSDDFNDPNTLTTLWSANSVYSIAGGELANTSTANTWGHLAVFKANVSPISASLTWSATATSEGIDKGGLALLLDANNHAVANGYLAWIRTQVGENPVLYLFTLKAGAPDVFLGTFTATGAKKPGPGDIFKVGVTTDASGHHFDYYVNEKFYGRLDDPAKTYSSSGDYYMGIELHGNLANNVDRFVTYNTIGAPDKIEKVKPLGTPTGIVGKPLADSLIVRVTDKSGNPISGLTVDFTITQGGGKLDITPQDNYVRAEMENANPLESPMELGADPAASNGQFVLVNGGSPGEGKAECSFYVKEAGNYVIWFRMLVPNDSYLSLFVQVDGKPAISTNPPTSNGVWDFRTLEYGNWEWKVVTDRANSGDIATFNLTKGIHKITVTQRVATGVKLDKILLSNNMSYIPSGLENVPQYVTNTLGQARAQYTLGTVAGVNKVEAMVPGYTLTGAPVVFTINGNADVPVSMVASTATTQSGVGGQKLAQPFEVALKDKYNNPAGNYEITFTVTEGDGFLLNGQTVHKVNSDPTSGKAQTYLTLGTESANNKVVASYSTLPTVTFTATATSGVAKAMNYDSGNSQSAPVGTTLPNPLKVKVVDAAGNAVVNHNVTFQITAGNGSLVSATSGYGSESLIDPTESPAVMNNVPSMTVLTNASGIAAVKLVVGTQAGINTVEARSNTGGAPLPAIVFNAEGVADKPDTLIEVSGNNQTGAAGMKLGNPFVVQVADRYKNAVSGHKVQFSVSAGDGFLDGTTDRSKAVLTDLQGKAQVYLTLGTVSGIANKVTAESYIGEELFKNPGFEVLGTGGDDVFAEWTEEKHGASTVSDETSQKHSGSHACKINVVEGTDYHTTIIQDVTLNVNQEYQLSWWGKIVGATQIAYFIKNTETKRWWNGTTKQWVAEYTANKVTMTADYAKYNVTFQRENVGTAYQIHIRPIVNANHTIYLDDFSLSINSGTGGPVKLGGSPIVFSAMAGTVTTIQAKSALTHNGSAGWPLDDSLQVYIKDNYGNPVGGYPVTFSSTEGDNPGTFNGYKLKEIQVNTDGKGIARVAFICGTKPGVASRAKAIATGLTGSPVTFTANVADLVEMQYVDGNNQTGKVGSALAKPFKVKVIDQRGKAIPNNDFTFQVVKGGGNLAGSQSVTVKSDTLEKVAAVTLTLGPAPGDTNNAVEASTFYKGKALKGSPYRFRASASIGEVNELVLVSGNYQRTVVGSPLDPFVVKVVDAFGNPYADHPVTFTVKTGGGYLDNNAALKNVTKKTDASGKAQVILTVGNVSGENNNSVEVVSYKPGTQTHLVNSPMTFFASATANKAYNLVLVSGNNQPRSPVRQALSQPFVVKVTDKDNNPVPGHPVQWQVVQGNGTFDGLTDSIKTVNTNDNGLAQVFYYPGPIAGLQNVVRARSWNQVELNGSPKTFVVDTKAGAVSATRSVVSATSPVPADANTKSTITVTLMDEAGNKIPEKVLSILSVTGNDNRITNFLYPTDANGQALAYLASSKAEVKVITIRDVTDGINLVDTAQVRFTPLEPHHISYVSGTDQSSNFGTAVKDPIVARVYDVNGNPISDYPVYFEAYEGGGYIWEHRSGNKPIFTDKNGNAYGHWILGPSAEVNRARAVAEGLAGSGSVRYIATGHAGTAVAIQKIGVDAQIDTAGLPLEKPLTVKVVDKNGDPIFDYPVKFKVTFGGGNFSGESEMSVRTNPFGEASQVFTLGRAAGANVVSVEAPGLTGSPIGFTAQGVSGKAAKVVKWAGEGKAGPVGGQISGIQVKVTDIFDNAVAGYVVNFAVNQGAATIVGSGSVASSANGIASVSVNVGNAVGLIELMVAAPGLIGDGLKIRLQAVAATAVAMQIYSGNDQQGTIERELVYPLSVVVLDQYGNAAGGQNVPVSFVVTQGNGIMLDGPTVYANEKGIASARFQLGNLTGTSYKVWAINNALSGSPLEFKATGVTNKFPLFAAIPGATIRENQNLSFTVSATDADGDPVKYGIRNLPAGALFDSLGTKQFSWTPNYFQAGKYEIHFIAKDNKGGFDDEPVIINVENVNRMPQITYYEPVAHDLIGHKNIGEMFRFVVQVADPDNDELTFEWYDQGVMVSSKNYYDLYVANERVGSHNIVVKISDGYDTIQRDWALYIKTPVELASFSGRLLDRQRVELEWETTTEVAHAGFHVLRRSMAERSFTRLTDQLLPANGMKKYRFVDRNVQAGETYYYKLEDVSINGEATQHEPITITVAMPDNYRLYQNYPNPFNPNTHIDFQLPSRTRVTINIYNVLGQVVKTLVDEVKEAGYHSIVWNGLDNSGMAVASGVYYYQMVAGSYVEVKKMALVR